MQFFVQILVDVAGLEDGYAFHEDWFDTIDEAVAFIKEHDQGTLKLHGMKMHSGTKPKE